MIASLLERFRQGDRLALARLLTLVAQSKNLADIADQIPKPKSTCRVVAFTGSGGVGKSTLIGKLIEHIRGQNLTVAVLACDPESPLSGGALLGDRFRMPSRPKDDGVFIRSLATQSGHGAIAENLALMVQLCAGFGFDVVLIETVGAGQGESAVRDLADVVVLLLQPETGDELQWEKAGILEVADIFAVNKADLPGADLVAAQVRASIELSGHAAAVLEVSAKTDQGLAELWQAIQAVGKKHTPVPAEKELLRLAQQELNCRFHTALASGDRNLQSLIDQFRQGGLSELEAVLGVLNLFSNDPLPWKTPKS
jgi:LAO/AO transport system ATPase